MAHIEIIGDVRIITIGSYSYREDLYENYGIKKYRTHEIDGATYVIETSCVFTEFSEYPVEIIHCHRDNNVVEFTLMGELEYVYTLESGKYINTTDVHTAQYFELYDTYYDHTITYYTKNFVIIDIIPIIHII